MNVRRYSEKYHVSVKTYEDVKKFIDSLKTEKRRVIAYSVSYGEAQAEITVLFAEKQGRKS